MASARREGGPPSPEQLKRVVLEEATTSMKRATKIVEANWRRQLHPGDHGYRTGTYSRSITTNVTTTNNRVTGVVGTALKYAPWLEHGTGIYGPRHALIRPKKPGGVLRFPQPGNPGFTLAGRQRKGRAGAMAQWVYARYVRGIRPRLYAHEAARVSRPAVLAEFDAGAQRIVRRLEGWK
jgi:hypothetical protein